MSPDSSAPRPPTLHAPRRPALGLLAVPCVASLYTREVPEAAVCAWCGVLAIGSCSTCSRTYCRSHSSGPMLGDWYGERRDLCSACQADRLEQQPAQVESAASRSLQAAGPDVGAEIAGLLAAFVQQMRVVPPIDLGSGASGIRVVKHWQPWVVDSLRRIEVVGQGWFVSTPQHPGAVVHRDTSAAQTEYTAVLGLAVATDQRVFAALPPSTHDIEVHGADISGSVAALSKHTHGRSVASAEVISELSRLLDAAAASPVTLRPPKTKRDEREELAAVSKYRDEKIFGPGGQKAYKKRMYGK